MKPIKRSNLRIAVGTAYFRCKRHMIWMFGRQRFARQQSMDLLPYSLCRHHTPLFRELANVDLWLQHNKVHNLKIAIQKLNGLLLRPGETFSYWKIIGKPTRHKGYKEGMVLFYGRFKPGVGGGLCQLSNLIYWISLHSPLQIIERHRHSYDVFPDVKRTQPFGSGATCAYNYLDLQILNPTDQPYQLELELTKEHLKGCWRTTREHLYRYEVYERDHRIKQEYWGGYTRHNKLYRRVFNVNNEMIADDYITENNALMMYSPLLHEVTSGS